jgi:NAD(P)-dependent dehydrogenase (short-subunit alcohol dehydrogenase family)
MLPAGDRPLSGQAALVTGAGRGLGREVALGLAREGMSIGLLGRSRAHLDEVLRECARIGTRAVAVPADVTKPDALRAAVETVERDMGPLQLLVNNAGRIDHTEVPPWQADPGDWWAVVETNLRGPFNVCRAVLPGMVERGQGRVVNVNSGFGLRPVPEYSAYAVSKAALSRLTDTLAAALADSGVSVFDVSPGACRTDMTSGMSIFAGKEDWTPPERLVEVVTEVAHGRLDALSGRFIHAGRDDLDELLAHAKQITADDTRTLRLLPYAPTDPLT